MLFSLLSYNKVSNYFVILMFYDDLYNRLDLQFEIVDLDCFDRPIWLDVSFLFLNVYELNEMTYVVVVKRFYVNHLQHIYVLALANYLLVTLHPSLLYNKKKGENLFDWRTLNQIAAKFWFKNKSHVVTSSSSLFS